MSTGDAKQSPTSEEAQGVKAEKVVRGTSPSKKVKKKKRPSRQDEWSFGCQQIRDGLQTLQEMKSDFESWRDNMPDSLQGGGTYQKLDAICDLDLDSIESTLDEVEAVELPLGFGRD